MRVGAQKYTPEFRLAVRQVKARSRRVVARWDHKASHWANEGRTARGDRGGTGEQMELATATCRVARLRMERDITQKSRDVLQRYAWIHKMRTHWPH